MTALLETVVALAADDRAKTNPSDKIDDAVDNLRPRKQGKAKH